MPAPLTQPQVKDILTEIVSEKPEGFTYERHPEAFGTSPCLYRHPVTKAPDCIVGHFAARLGLTLTAGMEGQGADRVFRYYFPGIVDDDSRYYLSYVQSHQDAGKPWSEAIEGFPGDRGA